MPKPKNLIKTKNIQLTNGCIYITATFNNTLVSITDEKGNIAGADHIAIDIKNTLLLGSKLIAAIGLEDMVVVNTEDAVLVCPRNRTQEVRNIVETLKNNHRFEYL